MKISALYSQNSVARVNFKGSLYQFDNSLSSAQLKQISQNDYRELKARQQKGDYGDIFICSSKSKSDKEQVEIFKGDEETARQYFENFQRRIENIRNCPCYNKNFEKPEMLDYFENLDPQILSSLSDEFIYAALQSNCDEYDFILHFDEILEDEFAPEELEVFNFHPDERMRYELSELLFFSATNVLFEAEYENVIEYLHETAQDFLNNQ